MKRGTWSALAWRAYEGAVFAFVFVLMLVVVTLVTGNAQQDALDEIAIAAANAQRANACVLSLGTNPDEVPGLPLRDEGMVNAICLVPLGFAPVDVDCDGALDLEASDPWPYPEGYIPPC